MPDFNARRVLFYDKQSNRYHFARYALGARLLEVGSATLVGNHPAFHPQEKFRLLITGCGDRQYYKSYSTSDDIRVCFNGWLARRKGLDLQLDEVA